MPTSAAQAVTSQQPVRLILTAVASVLFLASLGQTVVSAALPVIAAELGGLEHITWLITAYLLASTVGAPIYGKLGDLFGRKIVMQAGILIFLGGSVVAGLAQGMGVMVLGRALQGLGGGGLIVVAMAVVADVLPARERGRAQGLLGGVFGFSTVVGPLVGGFVVEQLDWHWIFFLNLPLGIAAFIVLGVALDVPPRRERPRIDYAGAVLLAAFLTSAVLLSNTGGTLFAWSSTPALVLIGAVVVSLIGFVVAESRALEPILPLSLFANNNFVVSNAVGFMVGIAMFGAITFIPLYLQVVQGVSPTASGLFLIPMMGGLLATSMLAGHLMSRTGRYKLYPILSTGVLALAMLLLATLSPETRLWQVSLYMLIVGIGIGPVMSIGVTAIQNAVPISTLGVATASANMFRLIGGSLGTAAFGAMFTAGLAVHMPTGMQDAGAPGIGSLGAEAVRRMPPQMQADVLDAFSHALQPVFLVAATMGVAAFMLGLLLREIPLATTLGGRDVDGLSADARPNCDGRNGDEP